MNYPILACLLLLLGTIPGCKYSTYYQPRKQLLKRVFNAGPIPEGKAVIFIHGTRESIISKLVHKIDYPYGVISARTVQQNSILSRISVTLDKACPGEFGKEFFYFYGWHGKLTFPSRIQAAEKLFAVIKDHKGPLTIIAHSHGCSVALYLASLAEQCQHHTFIIDRLILLAPPVQSATKHLVHSPVFKEVYSFYSTADFMQIGDPQGLYWESYVYSPLNTPIPLLSKRCFDPAPNIIQTRIMLDRQSANHLHFMISRFLKYLPTLLYEVKQKTDQGGYEKSRNFFIVNIRPCGLPLEFLTPEDIRGKYVPRSRYHQARRECKEREVCTTTEV